MTIYQRFRAARAAVGTIAKNRKAEAGRRSYAYVDLAGILADVSPALEANGLSLRQSVQLDGGLLVVSTILRDDDGAEIQSSVMLAPPDSHDPQAWGSTLSYGRRYSLLATMGLAAEDESEAKRRAEPARPASPVDDRRAQLDALAAKLGGPQELAREIAARIGDAKGWRLLSVDQFAQLVRDIESKGV